MVCPLTRHFTLRCCPSVTVTLEAGGADTYAQRAIPGSEPSRTLAPSVRCDPNPCFAYSGCAAARGSKEPKVAAKQDYTQATVDHDDWRVTISVRDRGEAERVKMLVPRALHRLNS